MLGWEEEEGSEIPSWWGCRGGNPGSVSIVDGFSLGLFSSSQSCPFAWCLTHLALSLGLVTSEKESAGHILNRKGGGNLLAIIVGGSQEALDARPGAYKLLLKNRKGFVRLALMYGYGILGTTLRVGETAKMIIASILARRFSGHMTKIVKLVPRSRVSRYISIKETGGISGEKGHVSCCWCLLV